VGKSKADFAKPEKIEMKVSMEIPIFHFGSSLPLYFESTIAMIIIHTALKHQLRISPHLRNHRENQALARSNLETGDNGDPVSGSPSATSEESSPAGKRVDAALVDTSGSLERVISSLVDDIGVHRD
jgi:hypothetical protein